MKLKLIFFLLFASVVVKQGNNSSSDVSLAQITFPKDLPKVYDPENECINYNISMNENANPQSCPDKVWHLVVGVRLYYHFAAAIKYFYACLDWCFENPSCVAIYYQPNINWCALFNKSYVALVTKDTSRISAILKCCKLKEIYTNSPFVEHKLPINFDYGTGPNDANCQVQTTATSDTCKIVIFKQVENKRIFGWPLNTYVVNNSFDCMQKCLQEKSTCLAYGVDMSIWFLTYCYTYSQGTLISPMDFSLSYSFVKLCCSKTNDELWKGKTSNLLMLYQPEFSCLSVSTKVNCNFPFWHIQEEYRFYGHVDAFVFQSISSALNKCLQRSGGCDAVSFSYETMKAYFFKSGQYTVGYGEKQWTSYTLKCCDGFQ